MAFTTGARDWPQSPRQGNGYGHGPWAALFRDPLLRLEQLHLETYRLEIFAAPFVLIAMPPDDAVMLVVV